MTIRPLLLLTFFCLPSSAISQSYEWLQRIESTPGPDPGAFEELVTRPEQVAATEYGIYTVGRSDCTQTCQGFLAKYRAEDGKLLWQRKFSVFTPVARTEAFTLAVNEFGVFVAGRAEDLTVPAAARHNGSFVRLYDHDGNTVWTARDERRAHELWDIELDEDSLYVIGTKLGINQRAVVRRLAFDGTVLWTRTFSDKTDGGYFLELVNGRLYAQSGNHRVFVIRAEDGALLGNFPVEQFINQVDMLVADGFLYLLDRTKVVKYGVDGTEIWRFVFSVDAPGLAGPSAGVLVEDGLLLSSFFGWPDLGAPIRSGAAYITLGFDGIIRDVVEMPDHDWGTLSLAVLDGTTYATGMLFAYSAGSHTVFDGYTARLSDKDLLPPSMLSLAGATPAMPPRLAVLHHDYGAGPVRVGIRDAVPGSFEYVIEFSEGLTPVAFDSVSDTSGNGYEELVVVSRMPAVAEIRDSLDGRLVRTIEIGKNFDPVAATVDDQPFSIQRLAVAVRHEVKDTSLLRVYNLGNGSLMITTSYHRGFDAVDVASLPVASGSALRRFALLARNRLASEPHKVELRDGNGNLLDNFWIGNEHEPLELAVAGQGVDGLAVLRYGADTGRLDVQRIDVAQGDRLTAGFGMDLTPVAMLELPDADGNGFPEYAVYGEETGGESVKAETRDIATGALQHNVFTGKYYRPQDAATVGAIPGFSDDAFGLLGYRSPEREFRVVLADVDGTKLFDLLFLVDK